jgi:hypothetical protein
MSLNLSLPSAGTVTVAGGVCHVTTASEGGAGTADGAGRGVLLLLVVVLLLLLLLAPKSPLCCCYCFCCCCWENRGWSIANIAWDY